MIRRPWAERFPTCQFCGRICNWNLPTILGNERFCENVKVVEIRPTTDRVFAFLQNRSFPRIVGRFHFQNCPQNWHVGNRSAQGLLISSRVSYNLDFFINSHSVGPGPGTSFKHVIKQLGLPRGGLSDGVSKVCHVSNSRQPLAPLPKLYHA